MEDPSETFSSDVIQQPGFWPLLIRTVRYLERLGSLYTTSAGADGGNVHHHTGNELCQFFLHDQVDQYMSRSLSLTLIPGRDSPLVIPKSESTGRRPNISAIRVVHDIAMRGDHLSAALHQ